MRTARGVISHPGKPRAKMNIKKIELKNFQVIKDFAGEFEGNVYFITGDNELGKSTVLKALHVLLTGDRDAVLNNESEKGLARIVVGDDKKEYEVQLSFTKANPRGRLTIKSSDGMQSNNVSMLQKIFGYVDFDAVDFVSWSETADGRRKQVELVKSLLASEVQARIADIDNEVSDIKESRKTSNANIKKYQQLCDSSDVTDEDIKKYSEKKDAKELLKKQTDQTKADEKAKTLRETLQTRKNQLAGIPERKKELEDSRSEELKKERDSRAEIEKAYKEAIEKADADEAASKQKYEDDLKSINDDESDYKERKKNCEDWLEKYKKKERVDVSVELENLESHNNKYDEVEKHKENQQSLKDAKKEVEDYETRLDNLYDERETIIQESQLPIEGLSFGEDGLVLNGVPFAAGQVSDSQIMEVATKLIIAANPNVKVFRIARGESLGANRLQSIIDFAREKGYQGFIEEVHRGQDDLVIEEYSE